MPALRPVLIDNGHGVNTKGKKCIMPSGTMFEEWEFNRIIKLRLLSLLESVEYPYIDLVPESNDVPLELRTARENKYYRIFSDIDSEPIFISIHADAYDSPKAKGITVFTSKGETKADPIGNIFVEELSKLGMSNRYDIDENNNKGREANFYVLKNTNSPAVLLELGFYTNPNDVTKMNDSDFQEEIVNCIYKALLRINKEL